ncbi:hypothetical protein BV210_05765 [Halorientalis sp. IM1011]|uniref:hypothetical protein n=1 Tax=Halorientalis sp. IM1011 TaxID=1932360 RepID=UPI00097CD3CB|nr:hypothetical protein [Halorientalis sp. IM1011]AQL42249.1 hypothetical protein BV210_05765 [Halorientalis sp. IM1011]
MSSSSVLRYSYNVGKILVLLAVYVVALSGLTMLATGKRALDRIRAAGGHVFRASRPRSS